LSLIWAMGNSSSSSGSSSKRPGPSEPALPAAAEELSAYEAACRSDPELRTFDTTLQRRTRRAISTLAVGVEVRSMSLDSLREVTGCLLDMNQEVVRTILDCKEDIWKSPELFDLVKDYLESSLQTLDFCTALEKCLKRARDSQLPLRIALQRVFWDYDPPVGRLRSLGIPQRSIPSLGCSCASTRRIGTIAGEDSINSVRRLLTVRAYLNCAPSD
jgi:hypothetical protein